MRGPHKHGDGGEERREGEDQQVSCGGNGCGERPSVHIVMVMVSGVGGIRLIVRCSGEAVSRIVMVVMIL